MTPRLPKIVLVLCAGLLAAAPLDAQGKGPGRGGGGGGGGGGQPPADPEIAYTDGDLEVMNVDGSNATTLLDTGRTAVRGPAWSPDNSAIVVGATVNDVPGLYVVAVDGSGVDLLVPLDSTEFVNFPDWSPAPTPDGREKIAYHAYAGTNHDIWVVDPDGSSIVNLTATPGSHESYPTFSRDGTKLAYVRDFRQLVIAYLGVVDGRISIVSEFASYTKPTLGSLAFPEWGRTQDLIVVSETRNQLYRIVVIDVFGALGAPGVPMVLTPSSNGDERWASFSPDDTRVVFHRGGAGGGVFTTGIDGTGETRISKKGYDPAWRR